MGWLPNCQVVNSDAHDLSTTVALYVLTDAHDNTETRGAGSLTTTAGACLR